MNKPSAAMIPGWRFYLALGLFVGYSAGSLTIGLFWWWGAG